MAGNSNSDKKYILQFFIHFEYGALLNRLTADILKVNNLKKGGKFKYSFFKQCDSIRRIQGLS